MTVQEAIEYLNDFEPTAEVAIRTTPARGLKPIYAAEDVRRVLDTEGNNYVAFIESHDPIGRC